MKTGIKVFFATILVLALLGVVGFLSYKLILEDTLNENKVANSTTEENATSGGTKKQKEVQIWKGNERPIAVSIDNQEDARPQSGFNEAAITYEFIAEGGITRYIQVFKGSDLNLIGPVRSARHYFLDYAMENDAIFTHFGWSPQAEKDIYSLGINNINGMVEDGFRRTSTKDAPHNAITTMKDLKEAAKDNGYRTTSTERSPLNYIAEDYKLSTIYKDKAKKAEDVSIKISYYTDTRFVFDKVTDRYFKYEDGKQMTTWVMDSDSDEPVETKEPVTTKNVIIIPVEYSDLPDTENKGRQDIDNIGTLKGWYLTNGEMIEITATKTARDAKTVYADLEGNEIRVNDGNTFIEMISTDSVVKFADDTETSTTTNTEE